MKKISALLLTGAMLVGLLSGCGATPNVAVTVQPEAPAASAELKTGLGVISSAASSIDAGAEDGLAQVDVIMAAVSVDTNGVIVNCKIDAVQAKLHFSSEGKLVTPADTAIPTKNEMAEAYALGTVSSIGKEWNQQAEAFAQYCVGKTAQEVSSIAMTEGKATDPDLASSVTIYIGEFMAVVQKAAELAK